LSRALTGLGLTDGKYEGPTGFLTVLQEATVQRGLTSASVWAAAPVYLRDLSNPKLSAALLDIVEKVLKVDLGLTELQVAGRDLERRIDSELADRPDLERFVRRLASDTDIDLSEMSEDEDLLDDLEQYLQRLHGDEDDDD